MKRMTVQLIVAILLTLGGIVLLFSGFWVDPDGVIDSSVLVAFLKESGLVFDQAIVYPKRNFLHISLKEAEGNRMQILLNNRSYPVWGWWIIFGIILFCHSGIFLMIQNKR